MNHATPRRTPRTRDLGGYSLIEVLTVLVLIGILVAIAGPRIDLKRYELDAAVETAGSTILRAQRAAVHGQHNVVVAVDVAGARLRVHEDADNDLAMDPGERVRFEPLGEGVRVGRGGAPSRFAVDQAVTFAYQQAGWPAVVFRRNGSASEEGGFYLTSPQALASGERAQDTRAVEIERSTGRATWYRYSPPEWERGF